MSFDGKCVHLRGLARIETLYHVGPGEGENTTTAYLYKNGADLAAWSGDRDHPPTFRIALLWQSGSPEGLKKYPQFIEVTGRFIFCRGLASCGQAPAAIAVSSLKVMPTAMD